MKKEKWNKFESIHSETFATLNNKKSSKVLGGKELAKIYETETGTECNHSPGSTDWEECYDCWDDCSDTC